MNPEPFLAQRHDRGPMNCSHPHASTPGRGGCHVWHRMFRLLTTSLLVLPGLSACNGITEPEDPTPIGTYELASLDGNPVPYWFIDVFEDTITVSRATLVISANQRFFIEISGADSSLGNVDETYSGSWSTTIPTRIELRYTGDCVETGEVTHESITIDSDCDGFVWLWTRI